MVMGARAEKADKEEQMKLAWLANNSYGPVSFVSSDLQVYMYRVFHLKKFDSTLCLGDFLLYSEAAIGVKSSNRVGALTFRQEN